MSSRSAADPGDRRPGGGGEWVVLVQQLRGGPSNPRVKTWRRLQELGALPLRNAVYVLPNSAQAREDFAWLRQEIIALGGQATVFVGDVVDGDERHAIIEAFRRARSSELEALRKDVDQLAKSMRSGQTHTGDAQQRVSALRQRLLAIRRLDFFAAPGGAEAEQAITELEEQMSRKRTVSPSRVLPVASKQAYRNRVWVTRSRPGVDRMASAWLIKRFIDPRARFAFTDREHEPPRQQVPFDMFVGEFSHQGDRCTFEVLVERFRLSRPALDRIAEIVHDLDLKDSRFNRPENAVIGALVDGIRTAARDDADALKQGATVFEGVYRSFETAAPQESRNRSPRRLPAPRRSGRR